MTGPVIDLFAGPGGWDIAATALGVEPLGIEWDDAACATRRAAGLRTRQADVGALDPAAFAPCWGLIASPPCQAFSMAGKGTGRAAIDVYAEAIGRMAAGDTVDRDELDEACGDERAHLVLEPLRWALALTPRWVALEQVEPVMPLWEATATALRAHGYQTWTGVLSAERYGVPQTRRRAILLASLDGPVGEPPATHARYVPPRRRDEQTIALFDAPDPERITLPEDEHLLPWVSMAEALGWAEGPSPSPSPTITSGGGATGGVEVFAGRGSRERASQAVAPTHYDRRQGTTHPDGTRTDAPLRPVDEPAPTIASDGLAKGRDQWVTERLATAVCGDPRVFQPGGHHTPGAQSENAIRVSEAEAAVLQSFPADYPWQGTRSKRFQQIGNAIPPLMARAILREAIGAAVELERAA